MKHWTQEGSYVAGLALLVAGIIGGAAGYGWPAVAALALAVALLVALRALESRAEIKAALGVADDVKALAAKVADYTTVKETAESALRTAREANTHRSTKPTY